MYIWHVIMDVCDKMSVNKYLTNTYIVWHCGTGCNFVYSNSGIKMLDLRIGCYKFYLHIQSLRN